MNKNGRSVRVWAVAAIAGTVAILGGNAFRRRLRAARDDHERRPALWNRFYTLDWGATTTNNYGFAPAEGDHPQRFQHQMYRQMLAMLIERRALTPGLKLLEVSCGRGGGLAAFLAAAPDVFDATGLDVAASAVAFCRREYGEDDRRRFVEGSALDLPFTAAGFDVVLNVEASNDYGDRPRFFREVARVLKPDGVFLYADSCKAGSRDAVERDLAEAGFAAEFTDITANVVAACRADSPRRGTMIRAHAPLLARLALGRQLANYAAIEGSDKFAKFVDGRRTYLMTAAVKP